MRWYKFKINWVFTVSASYVVRRKELHSDLRKALDVLGVQKMSRINLLDINFKNIGCITGYQNACSNTAALKYVMAEVRKLTKEDLGIHYVELIR